MVSGICRALGLRTRILVLMCLWGFYQNPTEATETSISIFGGSARKHPKNDEIGERLLIHSHLGTEWSRDHSIKKQHTPFLLALGKAAPQSDRELQKAIQASTGLGCQ